MVWIYCICGLNLYLVVCCEYIYGLNLWLVWIYCIYGLNLWKVWICLWFVSVYGLVWICSWFRPTTINNTIRARIVFRCPLSTVMFSSSFVITVGWNRLGRISEEIWLCNQSIIQSVQGNRLKARDYSYRTFSSVPSISNKYTEGHHDGATFRFAWTSVDRIPVNNTLVWALSSAVSERARAWAVSIIRGTSASSGSAESNTW